MKKQKYFIFIDETWTNKQDRFFWLGCLLIPVEEVWSYMKILEQQYQKILSASKQKEQELSAILQWQSLLNFYKWRKAWSYEMKFKYINTTTQQPYQWLISKYFSFEKARFCCLIIDRDKNPSPGHLDWYNIYINQLIMLVKNNIKDNEEVVILPDNITIPTWKDYENDIAQKLANKCFWVHRIESHSSFFLQMVDVLTWAVVYDYKWWTSKSKICIVQKIQEKVWKKSLAESFTTTLPNYFSIREYKKRERSWL